MPVPYITGSFTLHDPFLFHQSAEEGKLVVCYFNDGGNDANAVQNQFTAYLQRSLAFRRLDYLRKKHLEYNHHLSSDSLSRYSVSEEECYAPVFANVISDPQWISILEQLRPVEQEILIRRVLKGQELKQIARDLGLKYGTVKVNYCRLKIKIQKRWNDHEF